MLTITQHAQARLRELRLPDPPAGGVQAWCHLIGDARGRAIRIRYCTAAELGAVIGQQGRSELGPCGLWLATADTDYILVDEAAPTMLREHTILHELAHLLLGHTGTNVDAREEYQAERLADQLAHLLAQLRPEASPRMWIRRVISGPSRQRNDRTHSMAR